MSGPYRRKMLQVGYYELERVLTGSTQFTQMYPADLRVLSVDPQPILSCFLILVESADFPLSGPCHTMEHWRTAEEMA